MLKNLIIYRIGAELPESAEALAEKLATEGFQPCGNTQRHSMGWVPPRCEPCAPLVECIDGQWIVQLQHEERILPACVVADHTQHLADKIEDETGRRPGRKQMKDLKEQAALELLPQAFTRRRTTYAWIDPGSKTVVVDASTQGRADDVTTLLVKAFPEMNLHLLQSHESPAACMAAWLMDGEPPPDFTADRDSELRSSDDLKSAVRYTRHNLDINEVRDHLRSGKMPKLLAMTWKERISFVLTDTLQVRRVEFLDIVFEGRDKPAKDEAFDVDVALFTGELRQLIPALLEALGGEMVLGVLAAAAGQEPEKIAAPHMPGDGPDPLYDQAVAVVVEHKRASISLVQRHLRIGYNRAARLLEEMEKSGLVSAMKGDGGRDLRKGVPA